MGIPIIAFRLLGCVLSTASLDVWFLSPLLLLGVVFVVSGAAADMSVGGRVVCFLFAAALGGAFAYALRWARQMPEVPDEDDVPMVHISDGPSGFPKAPTMLDRADLVCTGSRWFRDKAGRRMLLRGVNLGSNTKLPTGTTGTALHRGQLDAGGASGSISFVGRPFPLEEADEHLGRLRSWGFTFLRLLTTWEAVEHAGPGQYDEAYIAYLVAVVRKCKEHGIGVFIDFHQDVWSRWTGGDGAPAWTLLKVGFDIDNLDASGAAVTEQAHAAAGVAYGVKLESKLESKSKSSDAAAGQPEAGASGKPGSKPGSKPESKAEARARTSAFGGEPLPPMVWNSNNQRLAAATMWTLFFAGNDFAPKTLIDGTPAQEWLQAHFCGALARVARALKDEPNVIGFDVLNEPSVGYVGRKNMKDESVDSFYVGWRVSPWNAVRLGAGETVSVDYFSSFLRYGGKRELNVDGVSCWQGGSAACVWRQNGVWQPDAETGAAELLAPRYFATKPASGEAVDFLADYAQPFWLRASRAVRAEFPDAVIFVEPVLDMTDPLATDEPELSAEEVGQAGFVWAKHWYDGTTLMAKGYSKYLGFDAVFSRPLIGAKALERGHGKAVASFNAEAAGMGAGGSPVLVGEVGVPFDMTRKAAFKEGGSFAECTRALNTSMRALEIAAVSATLWNYNSDNSNAVGDDWNGEDLSLWSRDQIAPSDEDSLHAGGRSLAAAVRPYPFLMAGTPTIIRFQPYRADRRFEFAFISDRTTSSHESVIFLPRYQYPHGATVMTSDGHFSVDWDAQTLTFTHNPQLTHHIVLVLKKQVSDGKTVALGAAAAQRSFRNLERAASFRRLDSNSEQMSSRLLDIHVDGDDAFGSDDDDDN